MPAPLKLLRTCVRTALSLRDLILRACPGAAREYPQEFVDDYLRMVRACAEQDRTEVILRSTRMGFLTGAKPSLLPARMRCPGTVLASAAKGLENAVVE